MSSSNQIEKPPRKLVNIQHVNPRILVDLRYSTLDNFTGEVIYDFQECLLLDVVAKSLDSVQRELESQSLGLKVFDGYRPLSAQWKFWNILPDERYVSDPRKGGRHCRGTAVDVTLVTERGVELPMPSFFDDFSERAHRDYKGAPLEAIHNRNLLEVIMERNGFVGLPTEWWHFDLLNWMQYPTIEMIKKGFSF